MTHMAAAPSPDSTYSWGYRTFLRPSSYASWRSFSTFLAHVSAFCNNNRLPSPLAKFLYHITLSLACAHGSQRFTSRLFYTEIPVPNHGCAEMASPEQACCDASETHRLHRSVMNVDTIAFLKMYEF